MQNQNTRGNNDTPHNPAEAQSERRDEVHPSDLTRFQIDQLAAIAQLETSSETCYGVAIKEHLEAYYGEEIHHPRHYQNLDALADLGLLEQSDHDGRTNQYTLTAAGRSLLVNRVQWLADQAGLRVVDAEHPRDHDDDHRPDGGAVVAVPDGGWSIEEVRERLQPVRDEVEVTGVYSSESVTIADHDCLQVNLSTPDGHRVAFGCIHCGHVSNAATGFVQNGCEHTDRENPLTLTDGGVPEHVDERGDA